MRYGSATIGLSMATLLALGAAAGVARADDAATGDVKQAQVAQEGSSIEATPGRTESPALELQTPSQEKEKKVQEGSAAETQNARAATLEGSKSAWSGQLQFTYMGSTLNDPFAKTVPNPSGQAEPLPVELTGVVALRYRLSDTLTAGFGTGFTSITPFQGQQHTTVADPQVDVAKSFMIGPIHNRIDTTLIWLTSYAEMIGYGEGVNLDITDESFYEWNWGGTLGLALEYDFYTLRNDVPDAVRPNQLIQDYLIMPYAEYAFNDKWNLRTIIHFTTNQLRGLPQGKWQHPDVTQNLGIGYAPTKAVFLYLYGQFDPYSKTVPLAADTTTVGLQAIINLF